jgi:PAS domain-containing protein
VKAGVDMMVPLHHWPAPALIVRSCGRIAVANAAMAACLGTEPAVLVGKTLAAWTLDDGRLADFLRKGSESPCEIRFRAGDGNVRLLALSIARRAVPDGDVVTAIDMTLCRAVERKLRDECDRYFDMIRAGSDWFYESETTNQRAGGTEARVRLIRSGPDGALKQYELHTKWPDGLVDPSYDSEDLAVHMKRMTAHEPFRDMIHRQVDAQGKERYFRASGVPYLRDGFYAGYRGVSTNVTEQVLADQAARRERTLLEAAQRIARYGSAARDLATGAETWSRELCHLLGLDPAPEASREKRLTRFVHDEDRASFAAAMAKAEAGQPTPPAVIRMVRPNGAIRRLEVAMELLRDPSGNPDCLLMVFKDATQRL